MNARKGKWPDRSTRDDGVEVDCVSKTLEAHRSLNTELDALREGWQARKHSERRWSRAETAGNDMSAQRQPPPSTPPEDVPSSWGGIRRSQMNHDETVAQT
jgi:hypothetical protein